MNSKRRSIINILLILIACFIIIVGVTIVSNNQHSNLNEPETTSDSETHIPQDITFATDEETYNYAVSLINQKKYYAAIKYLRQIPEYKDSDALQTKVYTYINNYNFTYSSSWLRLLDCEDMNATALSSGLVLNRGVATSAKGKIVQCLSDGYIDANYTFHLLPPKGEETKYNQMYEALINYNQSVPIVKLQSYYTSDSNALSLFILTNTNHIVYHSYHRSSGEVTFIDCNMNALESGEIIVDIISCYALSNKGNVYQLTFSGNYLALVKETGISDAIALRSYSSDNGEALMVLTTAGTIKPVSTNEFPAVSSWSDIVSMDVSHTQHQNGQCFGLTSTGTVLVCPEGSSVTETPFPKEQTFKAISCGRTTTLAALTTTGDVYIYDTKTKTYVTSAPNTDKPDETETESKMAPTYDFGSDKVIYDYAVSQLLQRKYYSAIKYLRLIPEYKDSAALQTEAYKHMNQEYFIYFGSNDKFTYFEGVHLNDSIQRSYIINLQENVSFTGTVAQNMSYGFLDSNGNLYITRKDFNDGSNPKYTHLKKYNETTKFQQIEDGLILTKDGNVVHQGSAHDSDPLTSYDDFTTLTSKDFLPNEKIVYIKGYTALSNMGNVFRCSTAYCTLTKDISLSNIVSIQRYANDNINTYITTEGTVICDDEKLYPDIKKWTNVISIEMNSFGCIGLTADGKILLASKDGTYRNSPFPDDVTYIAIATANSTRIAAVSSTGKIYTYEL